MLAALADARIVREGPHSPTYPCGEPGHGCEREVRDLGAAGKPFDKRWIVVAAKKLVSRLRATLKAVFGIDDDPFSPFDFDAAWKTRFRANAAFGESGRR